MDKESKILLRKFIIDFVCLFVVAFPILLFYLFGQPFERGFFCDDESLRYPYKDSTVTSVALYIVGMVLPISTIIITEYIHCRIGNACKGKSFFGKSIPPWVWESYRLIGVFGFGVACSHLTTDIAKYSIGRLRPHFFAVCNPSVNCSNSALAHTYIQSFRCQGSDPKLLKEMRLSFPSGHSSYSAYTMVYFAMYLQGRMTWKGSKLLRHFFQYGGIALAVYTAMSRVSDYKHHWSDVLVGSAQGALVAVLTALYISDIFRKEKSNLLPVAATDSEQPSNHTENTGTNRIC